MGRSLKMCNDLRDRGWSRGVASAYPEDGMQFLFP